MRADKTDADRLERARGLVPVLLRDAYALEKRCQQGGRSGVVEPILNHLFELGYAIGCFDGENGVQMLRALPQARK